uniref:Retrotransposon protein, putative, Ty3-gypsy subclass n=1 Tax=Oryza sativa subsp. japonica TaxID=39947 RepID=Q10I00_ORYSJ|nr:retrotransposon protein, putative, Ty3-gypsy subclass [Oryza sativa Japonica Group]
MPLDDYWPAAVAVAVAGNGMATAPSLTTTTTTLSGLPPRLSMSRPRPDAANHWRSSSPRRLVPARSHPSSMASLSPATTDAEQSANVAATNLPWLDLGHANPFAMMDHYAGVLDELRWSDYFDGAYQAFRFSSLDFITNDFGKISLLDSDSNQSGRNQVPVPFGIPNSAEAYSKIISPKSVSSHSDEIQSIPPRSDQDDGSYPSILMKLPDDLAAVFTAKTSPTRRSRRAPAPAPIQSTSREVGVILQPLGTVSTEELDGYLSSPGVSSRPTEILDYDDFGYHYDHGDFDNFDDSYEDNYTPLFFGVFMADNETEEQRRAREAEQDRARQEAEHRERIAKEAEDRRHRALVSGRRARELIGQQDVDGTAVFRTPQQNVVAAITLLDTLLKEDALNQADHVVNILNQTKTMIATSVPANSASTRTPTGSRVPHHQPSLSITGTGSSRRSRGHDERSVHSLPERHRERRAERPRSPPRQRPVDLRDTINQRRAARGHRHSPNRYDDDVDGVAAFTNDLRRVDWPVGFKPTGIEKYDGTTNLESWLTVYGLAIRAAGGDSKAMANYLPVALADSARSWLHGLPRGMIGSWAKLRDHFIANFQGTFERPGTQFDLYNVIQKSGESLRDYIRRFSEQRNKISDITDDVIIATFTKGIRHEDLVRGSGNNNHKDRKRKPEELVATTSPSSRQRPRVNTFDKIMNSQCPHHPNSNHVAKDCFVYKQFAEQYVKNARKPADGDQGTSKKKDDEDDAPTGFQDHRKELNHIFGGPLAYESKRKQKLTEREINAVQPNTPQYLRWSETAIKFDRSDHPDRVVHPGRYPLVLDPVVRNVKLRRTLIDGGSALNILFAKTLDDMQIPRTELKPSNAPFHGVIPGLSATPLGQITLPVTFGTRENFRTENVCFEVADFETAYHAILGRPALAKFMAVPHYTYMMMKMPGPRGVISLRSDIKQAVTCDKESYEMAQTHETTLAREEIRLSATTAGEGEVPATKLTKTEESDAKAKKIPLDPSDPDKTANNKDIFAWKPSDMPGIPREVIEHSLHVKEDAKPIKQRLRRFAQDRKDAIKEELTKLLAAGFIKEVLHPDWLANPVLVRKKTGQWRMCVDYTDLKKSCPKDPFGLHRIDQVVDSTAGCELLSFLDCYSGYHQIRLKESDYLKTSFITPFGAYCYITMPFGLKNAGATYQRMIQRKLSHYFQSHSVTVVTSFPLGDILHNREANGRIAKWALELMSLDISFKPRTSIKSQALADFLAEWTECQEDMPEEKMEYWTMHFDGSKRLTGTGAGVVLISPTGERLSYVLWIHFSASHNVAEYEALLHGLRIAISLGIRRLIVRGDSQLGVNQVTKEWSCLDVNMTAYRQEVRKLEDKFDGLELTHVLRHNNEAADRLANFGSKLEAAPSDVFVEHLYEPTVPRKEITEAMDTQGVGMLEADWREPFIKFLSKQELPQDKNEVERISRRSRLYIIHETELYKKSPSGILQCYVSLEEGKQLLKDIHSGICGNHAAARTIVGKAYRQGFFWPTAVSDVDKIVRTCEGCQFFARQTHLPAQELQTIPLSWPFAIWGLDMVGPFKRAVGGYTHLFVAIDKFSKWIEAKPVITITADKARDFFINIVHQFGVPNRIITDNGTQFTGGTFKDFCEDFGIKICYASMAHPMSNGQVERANSMILQGIKARVFDRLRPYAGKWVDQLPSVLWSLRTTPSRATGQSPFFLVYGAEAMLPSEVEFESLRFRNFNEEGYEEGRVDDINRLEEAREAALIQSTRYLQGLRRYHNRNV